MKLRIISVIMILIVLGGLFFFTESASSPESSTPVPNSNQNDSALKSLSIQ